MTNINKGLAEFLGSFWLVLGGCGSAVLAAGFPDVGIGLLGVSLAFGLTVVTMAYAIGHISGCHLNPAVTFGLWAGGRFPAKDIPTYVIAQVLGAIAAAFTLYVIASGNADYSIATNGLAANGFEAGSPGKYSLAAAFLIELLLTFFFIFVIMGATDGRAPAGFAQRRSGAAGAPRAGLPWRPSHPGGPVVAWCAIQRLDAGNPGRRPRADVRLV